MIYLLIHFLHVIGALGMAAAYAVETAGLIGMRRATEAGEARAWLRTRRWVLMVGPASIGLVLASGVYTIVSGWGWPGWIVVSSGSLVALAAIGGILTGIPMARIAPDIERADGALSEELRHTIRGRLLAISITTRIAVTLGIVFLMVRKPDLLPSVAVIGSAAAIGLAAGSTFRVALPKPMTSIDGRLPPVKGAEA